MTDENETTKPEDTLADSAGGESQPPESAGSTPPPPPPSGDDTPPIAIEKELSSSYLDYAMSVIVSRALPDVCDGLKPVHRRILYAMHESKCDYNKPYRKSARVVGDVMGKYHPHGDQSIYDALVRMAQDFSMRLPLLDGQGNFGSVDGDPPAAMRYTEIRLDRTAHAVLADIESGTVDFQDNYDNSAREPKVLPSRLPNLLINGANGIAVGMATNIPPHNPNELISGCLALLRDPEISDAALLEHIPAPDFPTKALIVNKAKAAQAILTGRGSFLIRAKYEIEEARKGRERIVVSEIPYQVNKASLVEKIGDLVRDKQIEGISGLRDESNREGMRIVIDVKRDAQADIICNKLLAMTPMQTSFGVNMLALNQGRPELMGLRAMLQAFLDFRERVVVRRAKFDLNKARNRAHILVGLALAVANIDEVIKLIRASKTPADARAEMLTRQWDAQAVRSLLELIDDPRHQLLEGDKYQLSVEQANAILELRLQRLTALGRDEIDSEMTELEAQITDFLEILRSRERVHKIIADELQEVGKAFETPRLSQFTDDVGAMDEEDLIADEDMAVTLSHVGYVKRVPLTTYRAQKRGGRGRAAMSTKDEDFVTQIYTASTHQPVMFFSSRGMVYRMKIWQLPQGTPQARGKALVNLLPLEKDESIATLTLLPKDPEDWKKYHLVFATSQGSVRRNDIAAFENINRNGKIAMKLSAGENLVGVQLCTEDDDVLLTTKKGQAIRFPVKDLRVFQSRNSSGVRGINLAKGDEVISMAILHHARASIEERDAYLRQTRQNGEEEGAKVENPLSADKIKEMQENEEYILTVSENGFGKRSSAYEYRISGRGGKGIAAMKLNAKTGELIAAFAIAKSDEMMLITPDGVAIRSSVADVRIAGRATQGVKLMRLDEANNVASVVRIADDSGADETAPDNTSQEA